MGEWGQVLPFVSHECREPNKPASPTPNCGRRFARGRSSARAAVNVGRGNQFAAIRGKENIRAPCHRQRRAQPEKAGDLGQAEKNADSPPAAAFGPAQAASSAHRLGARRLNPSN